MTDSRVAAYNVLKAVEHDGAYSPKVLDIEIKKAQLSRADASFVSALVYGTLEKQHLLDYYIEAMLVRREDKIGLEARIVLRMAAYQLLFMDKVPDFSAINEAVELIKSEKPKKAGFVNGVLRSLTRQKDNVILPSKEEDMTAYLSVRYSVIPWIAKLWQREFGDEIAEKILCACEKRPTLNVCVNTLKTDADKLIKELESEGVSAVKSELFDDCIHIENTGSIDGIKAYDKGMFYVQDEASRFLCHVFGAKPGERVMDVCSAPGGKSFTLARLMDNKGEIISRDISDKKLRLVSGGARRLGIDIISTFAADAATATDLPICDRVLCDVPCSGLGVIRRKPEIRYKQYTDVERLPPVQSAILQTSSAALSSGGVLMYSTCTLRHLENLDIVERFLKNHPDFEPLPYINPFTGESEWNTTLLPCNNNTDGFFTARLVKI